jgi:hypothetical protein
MVSFVGAAGTLILLIGSNSIPLSRRGFIKIEFTVYEERWNWDYVLLDPLRLAPEPLVPIAEPDPTGEVIFDLADLPTDMIIESKGGSVGEEGAPILFLTMFQFFNVLT